MTVANLASLPGFTLVKDTVMQALDKKVVDLSIWTTDFSSDLMVGAGALTSHYVSSTPSAATLTPSAGYTSGSFVLTPVTVGVNILYSQVEIYGSDLDNVSNPGRLENVIAPAIFKELAKKIEDTTMALVTSGNYSAATTGALASFDFAMYRNHVASGFSAGFTDFATVYNSSYIAKLESNSAFYARTSGGAYDDGAKIVRSDRLPTTGNLVGMIADKSALVVAGRALGTNDVQIGRVETVAGESGINVRFRMFEDAVAGKYYLRAETLFGAAKGNPNGLIRVVSG